MAEKVHLKNMRCPSCGAPLKAENSTDIITCVYCENSIVPIAETTPAVQPEPVSVGFSGTIKVDGIKTSSSALAYIEQLFEEYDWEAFAYAQTLTVAEIDKLANSCKSSSADDKNTWLVCFKAISVPYIRKIAGCDQILSSVIKEYKKDNLDAYSKFDAYKRIATMIADSKDNVIESLEKIADKAVKYGADPDEINQMKSEIENIQKIAISNVYSDIEELPEIKIFTSEKNIKIIQTLAIQGINAENEYQKAKDLIAAQNYVEALNTLLPLQGYADTNDLIRKIDRYYLISDVLENEGNLYFYKKNVAESESYSLYPTAGDKIKDKALVKNIGKIITNFADILYYIDNTGKLQRYNFSTQKGEKIYDKNVDKKVFFIRNRKAYFITTKPTYESTSSKQLLVELDFAEGTVNTIVDDVKAIDSLTDNKLIFTTSEKAPNSTNSYDVRYITSTKVLNVDTQDTIDLGTEKITIHGFINNCVVYTKNAPNEYNQNLYIRELDSEKTEELVEQNIYKFFDIISDRLFYYVGNSIKNTLITANCDGSDRKEWPLRMNEFLFEQGGWLYFVRKSGYNSVLCKSRMDGSKFCIIAADIDKFIEIKNGYLYYINYASALVKVRMDGSNLQQLCSNVETVLAVKEDKIIFVSLDDRIKSSNAFEQLNASKIVKSVYAVDFSGSGISKLTYNIKNAQKYDENTIYYITEEYVKLPNVQAEKKIDALYKLDVETYQAEKLLDLEVPQETKETSKFTIAMIVMGIAFFLAFIGICAGAPGLFVLCFLAGMVALMYGLYEKFDVKKLFNTLSNLKTDPNNVPKDFKSAVDFTNKTLKELAEKAKK